MPSYMPMNQHIPQRIFVDNFRWKGAVYDTGAWCERVRWLLHDEKDCTDMVVFSSTGYALLQWECLYMEPLEMQKLSTTHGCIHSRWSHVHILQNNGGKVWTRLFEGDKWRRNNLYHVIKWSVRISWAAMHWSLMNCPLLGNVGTNDVMSWILLCGTWSYDRLWPLDLVRFFAWLVLTLT
jgi:hypothetical protein